MRKCAFFDRDGVINEDRAYVYKISDFVFCEGLFELLDTLKKRDFLLLVITNQSGIARGYYTENELLNLHQYMQEQLEKQLGFGFDRIYYCPHHPSENCHCRKPEIGMITKACEDFSIDLAQSFFVGDKITDMQCAQKAGIKGKFLLTKNKAIENLPQNTQIVTSLSQLHSIITQNHKRSG